VFYLEYYVFGYFKRGERHTSSSFDDREDSKSLKSEKNPLGRKDLGVEGYPHGDKETTHFFQSLLAINPFTIRYFQLFNDEIYCHSHNAVLGVEVGVEVEAATALVEVVRFGELLEMG
jgi:hypothetical protein